MELCAEDTCNNINQNKVILGIWRAKKGVKWGKIWLKICPISYKVTSKTLNIRYRLHRWMGKCNMVTTYIIDHNQSFYGSLGNVDGG